MSRYQIHFVSGECTGQLRELQKGIPTLLGRSRSAAVRFSSLDISGKHLQLTLLPSGDVAMKNMSSHRTILNGESLTDGETVILNVGDRVLFGETSSFVLEEESESALTVGDGAMNEATCATSGLVLSAAPPRVVVAAPRPTPSVSAPVARDEAKTELPDEAAPRVSAARPLAGESTVVDVFGQDKNDRTELPDPIPEPKPLPKPVTVAPYARKPPVSPPPPPPAEEETEGRTNQVDAEESDNETMIMQTRVASLEELDLLRKTRKPKMQKWVIWLAAGLLVSASLVGASYFVSQTNIENPLTWPMDGKAFNDEVITPDIGVGKEFILYFPKHRNMKVHKEPNRIMAMTRLGKRRDVPCRIIFLMNKSLNNLSFGRAKGFKAWQDKMMSSGGQWNFDEGAGNVHFRGKEQGLPYQMARYTRSVDKEVWFGVVMYMKDRDWELVLQKEIPSSERYRGEQLLVDMPFMSVSQRYVLNHWEPGEVQLDKPMQEMMGEVKLLLNRPVPTPRMWPHILDLLRNSMVAALRENDVTAYSEATDLLRDFRMKQSKWLNNQKISYFDAQAKNLTKQAANIRQDCLTVFSDEDDLRCHQLRNDQWD